MNCKLTSEFFSIVKQLQEEQKQPNDYGTGQKLFHSEVSFLDAVYTYSDTKVSELSGKLGITKGAVTQIAQKLHDKGLIESYTRNQNKKEKYFRLTPLGETARKGHENYHERANQALCTYFRSLNEDEVQVIREFLSVLGDCMPFCEFQCKHSDCGAETE